MHLLFQCRFTKRLWVLVKDWLGLPFVRTHECTPELSLKSWWAKMSSKATLNRKAMASLTMLICWKVWKERNASVFNNKSAPPPILLLINKAEGCGRLSRVADEERRLLLDMTSGVILSSVEDRRNMAWGSDQTFSSRAAYGLMSDNGHLDASAISVWRLRLPTKIKIFTYLADIDMLSTRGNLFMKHRAPSGSCERCGLLETNRHVFFACSVPSAVWTMLGSPVQDVSSIWDIAAPSPEVEACWGTGAAVVMWHIWKSRNDLVFNARHCSPTDILRRDADDLALWRFRFPLPLRRLIDRLRTLFLSCCNSI